MNTLSPKENPDGTLQIIGGSLVMPPQNSLKILFTLNSTLPQCVRESHLPDSQRRSRHQSAQAFGAQ